jgi:putative transposase
VWQNRFYSCAVEEAAVASVMRYVELNPMRAGMVKFASDYAWSSADVHLGGPDAVGLVAMQEWSTGWTPEEWGAALHRGEDQAAAIREATYSGRPLGGDEFIAAVEARLSRRVSRRKPGRPKSARTGT